MDIQAWRWWVLDFLIYKYIRVEPRGGGAGGSIPPTRSNGSVAQLAEATDSKPVQCEFESHPSYMRRLDKSFSRVYRIALRNQLKVLNPLSPQIWRVG